DTTSVPATPDKAARASSASAAATATSTTSAPASSANIRTARTSAGIPANGVNTSVRGTVAASGTIAAYVIAGHGSRGPKQRSDRVERFDQPAAVDLLQTHLDTARRERAVGVLLAGGHLVEEHQHHRGIRVDLRDRGLHHVRGGGDLLLHRRRGHHRVGELGVVVEELAGQVFLGGREVL